MINPPRAATLSTAGALLIAIMVFAAPSAAVTAAPGEKISRFSCDITMHTDTSIDVREEFVVHSEGVYFQWGLIRYLPIGSDARWDKRFGGEWKDDMGIRITILEVTDNGNPVPYDHGSGSAYAQLRIGKENISLAQGDHRIVVRYKAEGVLRPLADRDELYWNVLGHYWQFPIDVVDVRVHFPAGARIESAETETYAGGRGVSNPRTPETELMRENLADGIAYRATHLGPAQSLSFVVRFPKGIVVPPALGIFSRNQWRLAAPLLVCLYYLIVWLRIGTDAPLGSVPVRYEPPTGLSPAAARFVLTTGCDARTLASVIAQLAARDCLKVELENGTYKLSQLMSSVISAKTLAPEEGRLMELLFENSPEASITHRDTKTLNTYILGIMGQLQKRLNEVYFTRNIGYVILGFLGSLAIAMFLALTATGRDTSGVLLFTWWFFFCASVVGVIFLTNIVPAVILVFRGLGGARQLIPGALVLAAFGSVFVFLLRVLAANVSPTYSLALAAMVIVNLAWGPALRRLTPKGRQAMLEIDGFRLFLEKVEQDRMHRLNATGESPEAAMEFVPYAIALEVKEAWGDHLAAELFATTTTR